MAGISCGRMAGIPTTELNERHDRIIIALNGLRMSLSLVYMPAQSAFLVRACPILDHPQSVITVLQAPRSPHHTIPSHAITPRDAPRDARTKYSDACSPNAQKKVRPVPKAMPIPYRSIPIANIRHADDSFHAAFSASHTYNSATTNWPE